MQYGSFIPVSPALAHEGRREQVRGRANVQLSLSFLDPLRPPPKLLSKSSDLGGGPSPPQVLVDARPRSSGRAQVLVEAFGPFGLFGFFDVFRDLLGCLAERRMGPCMTI